MVKAGLKFLNDFCASQKFNSVLFWNTTLFYICIALCFLVDAGKRREEIEEKDVVGGGESGRCSGW